METLAGYFSEWPLILCPVCQRITLEPSVTAFEDPASLAELDDPDGSPDIIRGYFHGVLGCPRTPCGTKYAVTGRWKIEYPDPASAEVPKEYYAVCYILPAMPLMTYPAAVPEVVRDLILKSSLVLLSDPSAAANRIRSAIEALLDDQHVRKYPIGKRSPRLTTHARIEVFRSKQQKATEHLMAMKWIGNVGSHEREVLPLSLVLDGLEHFAKAVELVYDPSERALERRANSINKLGGKFTARGLPRKAGRSA